jgi:transcriptional regulator GlxA family with amidase domain
VALADVLGAAAERRLVTRLEAAPTVGARLDAVEALVRQHRRDADPVVQLAAAVADDPGRGAAALASDAGWSGRQLRRRFDRAVGYGPGFYTRIARLQRFAHVAARHPERGLAELAASAGYTDQSHLARDTRDIAGRTPAALAGCLDGTSLAVELGDVRSVQDVPVAPSRRWAA